MVHVARRGIALLSSNTDPVRIFDQQRQCLVAPCLRVLPMIQQEFQHFESRETLRVCEYRFDTPESQRVINEVDFWLRPPQTRSQSR